VEYFNYLGSKITNDARYTREIISSFVMTNAALSKQTLFTSKLDFSVKKKLGKCYIWRIALCGGETWAVRRVDDK
jgi:hypothetical protein